MEIRNRSVLYIVCEQNAEGAIPLYSEIKGEICRYVLETAYDGESIVANAYVLEQNDKGGGGDGFGAEGNNMSTYKQVFPIDSQKLIFDTDGVTVLGYAYRGVYNYYCNGDSKRYSRDIFLPCNGAARHTDYEYSYTVYPHDGTASSSSSSKYTKFVRR